MNNRNAELGKIHIGAKQLGLEPNDKSENSAYRTMLWTLARVRSSKDLNEHQRHAVIKHLTSCGATFTKPKRAGKRPHNYAQLPEYITKVEALLADMKLPWSYADTIARNITGGKGSPNKEPGVEKLAWVKQPQHWRDIITALSVEQEKRDRLATVNQWLQQHRKNHDYLKQLFPTLPAKWQRNRRWLRTIATTLAEQSE